MNVSVDQAQPPENPAKARFFFALWPSQAGAEALAGVAREIAARLGGRATRPETIHLTLAFLGDVALSRLGDIQRAAISVAAMPGQLEFGGLEHWSRQSLVVARCPNPPALIQLVNALRASLAAAGVVIANGDRPFLPHVTLVRRLPAAGRASEKDAWLTQPVAEKPLPALAKTVWDYDRFVLVRSRLSSAGPDYEILSAFPLKFPGG